MRFKLTILLALLLTATGVRAQVLINEVDSDTEGTDILEFVELYGEPFTPLDGLVLVFFNGAGDLSYDAFDLDGYSLGSNGFFLIGNTGVIPTPSIFFLSNGLQNGADAVALYEGDENDFLVGTPVTTAGLIDAVVYDTNDADDSGLLVLLNPGEPQLNEDGGGDKDVHSNMRCPDGAGGPRTTTSFYQFTASPGESNDHACEPVADEDLSWGAIKTRYR